MRDHQKIYALVIVSILFSLFFIFRGITTDNYIYFLSNRIPKVLAIFTASGCIAISSLVFQTITNNRIITPSILGFDSLYVLIQSLMVIFFSSSSLLITNRPLNFFVATSIMIFLSYLLFHFYFNKRKTNLLTLVLIGMVCGSLFNSLTNVVTLIIDPNEFTIIQASMFASFNNINNTLVYLTIIPCILIMSLIYRYSRHLDVMLLGNDNAKSLGVDTQKMTKRILLLVSLLVSISTALIGPILFLGLIVISLSREIFRSYEHKTLMLGSSFLSIALLVSGQWFIENILNFETTISVIINFAGGIYFLILLTRNKVF